MYFIDFTSSHVFLLDISCAKTVFLLSRILYISRQSVNICWYIYPANLYLKYFIKWFPQMWSVIFPKLRCKGSSYFRWWMVTKEWWKCWYSPVDIKQKSHQKDRIKFSEKHVKFSERRIEQEVKLKCIVIFNNFSKTHLDSILFLYFLLLV